MCLLLLDCEKAQKLLDKEQSTHAHLPFLQSCLCSIDRRVFLPVSKACFNATMLTRLAKWSKTFTVKAHFKRFIKQDFLVCPAHLLNRENGSRFILAKIIGLGKSASEETFLRDQQRVTVADHFENNLGIPLENRNYPVLYCKQGGKEVMYPFDVCEIMDMQRVSTNALNAELTSALIREAATLPDLLQRRINDCFAELNLVNSLFMQNAGMEVSSQPVEVRIHLMYPILNLLLVGSTNFASSSYAIQSRRRSTL